MCKTTLLLSIAGAAILGAAVTADAYEIRTRFVHRYFDQDLVIPGNNYFLHAPYPNTPVRIRLQIGVFDDANGPAPAGGMLGWNTGTLNTSGTASTFTRRRTPGRLTPFTFSMSPNANGNPPNDPFIVLSEIDNTLGTQSPPWPAGSDPDSPPQPFIRGLNTFVSIYEITISTSSTLERPTAILRFGGNLIAAREWRSVGTPNPPTPEEPGEITYAPFPLAPVPFDRQLTVQIFPDGPTPGTGVIFLAAIGSMTGSRRRRAS